MPRSRLVAVPWSPVKEQKLCHNAMGDSHAMHVRGSNVAAYLVTILGTPNLPPADGMKFSLIRSNHN